MRLTLFVLFLFISTGLLAQQTDFNPIPTTHSAIHMIADSRIDAFAGISAVSSSYYSDGGLSGNPALLSKHSKHSGVSFILLPHKEAISLDMVRFSMYHSISDKIHLGYQLKSIVWDEFEIGVIPHSAWGYSSFKSSDLLHQLSYAHLLTDKLSVGVNAKYFVRQYSIIGGSYTYIPETEAPKKSSDFKERTFSVDFGAEYNSDVKLAEHLDFNYHIGAAITNLGNKETVQNPFNGSGSILFKPTNLNIGVLTGLALKTSKLTKLHFDLAYQADKLLVPTPPELANINGDPIIFSGYDNDVSVFRGLYQSFYDAPGGFDEEMKEITHRIAMELRIESVNDFFVALRFGKVMQNEAKGSYSPNTFGAGIGAHGFGFNFCAITLSESDEPLYRTFSLSYRTNFGKGKSAKVIL